MSEVILRKKHDEIIEMLRNWETSPVECEKLGEFIEYGDDTSELKLKLLNNIYEQMDKSDVRVMLRFLSYLNKKIYGLK